MHAIAPVVTRIGGDVDALGIGIGQTEVAIDGEPVLEREDAEQRWAGEVIVNYACADVGRSGGRTFALFAKFLVVVLACELWVEFPPLAECLGVVGAGGADAALWIPANVTEGVLWALWHTLDFE